MTVPWGESPPFLYTTYFHAGHVEYVLVLLFLARFIKIPAVDPKA